jgi:uncharacterized protein (DUF2062 family)
MKAFLKQRLVPIRALLTQGMSPRMLALSLAVGAIVGIFPVLGTTTILCTIAAAALRLNLVAVQTVHFLLTPVQLLLIIPFVRVGEWILEAPPQPLTIAEGMAIIQQGALHAISVLRDAILHAMLGWLLLGPVTLWLVYLVLKRVLTKQQLKIRVPRHAGSPS